jgi:phosphatidylglycerol---prolipoprotein diacylglyceryl transferase
MTPPVNPVLIQFGPLTVHWYGLLVVTGILLGAYVATYLAERAGENPERIWDMLMIAVIAGIIGARIEYVIVAPHWAYYREHLAQAFYIWEGGLRIYGAVVGGALGVAGYALASKLNPLKLMDFAAPGMAIGHAIGRWGNFINYELYGPPTDQAWGLHIPLQFRVPPFNDLAQYPPETRFHPTFLYESLANLLLCLILITIADRLRGRLKDGTLVAGYLIGYSIIRFLMDYWRTDATSAQGPAIAFAALGLIYILIRYQPWKSIGRGQQTAA